MIYVVGSLNMDLVISCSRMPKSGETLDGYGFFTNCGGKGANQAVAVAKLGGKVAMCGAVGNDDFGKQQIAGLQNAGVDVSHVKVVDGVSSGIAVIVVSQGNNRIILNKGANDCVDIRDVEDFLSNARKGDILLTQLEIRSDVVGYALQLAKKKGLTTILNPAPANADIAQYFEFVDCIVPNETELEILGGKERLFCKGIRCVVTTLGADGYEIAGIDGAKQYPCHKVEVVDTTSAGDTLCGGMVAELSQGKDLRQACAFGSRAATIACTRRGAQQSVPTRKEVESYVFDD